MIIAALSSLALDFLGPADVEEELDHEDTMEEADSMTLSIWMLGPEGRHLLDPANTTLRPLNLW